MSNVEWKTPPRTTSPDIWEGIIGARTYGKDIFGEQAVNTTIGFLAARTRSGWSGYLFDPETEETLAYSPHGDHHTLTGVQAWAIRECSYLFPVTHGMCV